MRLHNWSTEDPGEFFSWHAMHLRSLSSYMRMQPKSHCDQSRLSAIITALVGLTGCSHSEWHSPLNGRHRCRNPEDRRCLRVLGNCAHDTLRYCSQKTAALACHSKVRPACHSWTHRTGSACFVFAEYGRMVWKSAATHPATVQSAGVLSGRSCVYYANIFADAQSRKMHVPV